MKNNHKILKLFVTIVLSFGAIFSTVYAASTSQQGRNILNKLKNQGWSDADIKATMEDMGLDTSGYFPDGKSSSNTTSNSTKTSSSESNNKTSQQGRDILNKLKNQGWSDADIKATMEDMGLDTSGYFPSGSNYNGTTEGTYTSRSCKVYNIQYIDSLGAYTSPDLLKKEYFINIEYFQRYIDSKNPHINNCPYNEGWINTFYDDTSNSSDRYVAPNGKIYFITQNNGQYTSEQLSNAKSFSSINNLKNYIRNRNPLVWMGNNNSQTSKLEKTYKTVHGSATDEKDNQKLDNSDEAKRARDVARKNDLSQIQTAIITSQNDKGKWPQNSIAKSGMKISGITNELLTAGMSTVPTDPDSSNVVDGLGNIKGIGEYIYLVTNRNGVKDAGFALMAKTETADASNWITCDGEKNLDNGYITSSNDLNEIQVCTSLIKSNSCYRDNQGRVNSQKCYYSDENQLRYLLVY